MDQTTEEALRQELTYLRTKLQDQPTTNPQDYEDQIKTITQENTRLQTMLEGKLMNLQEGDILFIHRQDILTQDPNSWMNLAKKFKISIVSVPNEGMSFLAKANDGDLRAAGLCKFKDLDPYSTLDDIMHLLQKWTEKSKEEDDKTRIQLLKGGMSRVYDAMEAVKALLEYVPLKRDEVPPEESI